MRQIVNSGVINYGGHMVINNSVINGEVVSTDEDDE